MLIVIYIGPLMYVWAMRNVAETRARSPKTTTTCILLLMLDSICNTWIFSIDLTNRGRENWMKQTQEKCLLGVWVTMLFMVPILITMYIRIYRIKRVFEVYQKYLQQMISDNRSNSVFSYITNWNKENNLRTT